MNERVELLIPHYQDDIGELRHVAGLLDADVMRRRTSRDVEVQVYFGQVPYVLNDELQPDARVSFASLRQAERMTAKLKLYSQGGPRDDIRVNYLFEADGPIGEKLIGDWGVPDVEVHEDFSVRTGFGDEHSVELTETERGFIKGVTSAIAEKYRQKTIYR